MGLVSQAVHNGGRHVVGFVFVFPFAIFRSFNIMKMVIITHFLLNFAVLSPKRLCQGRYVYYDSIPLLYQVF